MSGIVAAAWSRRSPPPSAPGIWAISSPAVALSGAYPAADGQTLVLGTTNDREWQRLARDVLRPLDLADDARCATNHGRVRVLTELGLSAASLAGLRAGGVFGAAADDRN